MARTLPIRLSLVLFLLAGLPTSCGHPPGHPPVARFVLDPEYIPAGVATTVSLDGRRSCDELDHPEACAQGDGDPSSSCPGGIRFQWSFGAPVSFEQGTESSPRLTVTVATEAPVRVTLTVTDCDGRSASTTKYIGVILQRPTQDAGF